eukprot:sb/3476859/
MWRRADRVLWKMSYNTSYNECVNETLIPVCTFRLINGAVITGIGLTGTVAAAFISFNITTARTRLPGSQGAPIRHGITYRFVSNRLISVRKSSKLHRFGTRIVFMGQICFTSI